MSQQVTLRASRISKSFPGVKALQDVEIEAAEFAIAANKQAADAAAGRSKLIEASVTAVGPVNRAPQRIAVGAQVAYADKTLGGDGQVLEQTEPGTLSLTYVFGRDGKEWKLHEYIPGR